MVHCLFSERTASPQHWGTGLFLFLFPQPEEAILLEKSQEFFFPKSWDIGEIDLNSDLEKQLDGLERPSPGSTSTRCDQKAGQDPGGSQPLPKPTNSRSFSAIKRGGSSVALWKRLDKISNQRWIIAARNWFYGPVLSWFQAQKISSESFCLLGMAESLNLLLARTHRNQRTCLWVRFIYDIYYVDWDNLQYESCQPLEIQVAHYWFNGDTGRQIEWVANKPYTNWNKAEFAWFQQLYQQKKLA